MVGQKDTFAPAVSTLRRGKRPLGFHRFDAFQQMRLHFVVDKLSPRTVD